MERRNPRRKASDADKVHYDEDSHDDEASDDDASENPASSSDDEEEVLKSKKPTTTKRTSSRSTKFQASMKEPKDSVRDLFVVEETKKSSRSTLGTPTKKKSSQDTSPRHKSPAVRHSTRRRQLRMEVPVSSDEESESSSESEQESEQEEEEEEEALKIQRLLASRTETRATWKAICDPMNTSEIDHGSRWFQEASSDENSDQYQERFLTKWADLSYLHCSWECQEDLLEQVEGAKTYMTTFFRKSENGYLFSSEERCDGDYFDPGWTTVERILEVVLPEDMPENPENDSVVAKYGIVLDRSDEEGFEEGTGRQFLIKWANTPYSQCTYEFERDLILNEVEYAEHLSAFETRNEKPSQRETRKALKLEEEERRRSYKLFGDKSKMDSDEKETQVKAYQEELEKTTFANGGQLRDYQAEGVTWLMSNFINKRSSILADEMGLGKTIQTAAFVNLVATRMHQGGPFLIVAPLSTIPHWYREFSGWTNLNTFIYHGSARDREMIREFEMAFECDRPKNGVGFNSLYLRKCMPKAKSKLERVWMAQVVITTPEMLVTDDYTELTAVDWKMLVVDEAHRLKNHNSKLAANLRDSRFNFGHTLLLTGTPIQNNMNELWTLLNVIDPAKYDDMDDFLELYGDIKSKERIDDLHEGIRPYILRRLKEDVEKSVPPKEETLIECELTVVQKKWYRALYEKNVQFLHKNKKKALDGPSISNLAMQLRKCCNHPFLLRGVEDEVRKEQKAGEDKPSEGDFLVNASGKLVLLDKLLPRLKKDGHRVLLFSQFKIMLDILEDYLSNRQMKFERIDGSITGNKRQMSIDRFQAPAADDKEAPFIMLLSTRAGGVGINLTAADTCIIFDSDFNPQNDLQAQARCHRIGQTKNVKVYRLLTRKTYEMQMFHMSSLKMGLDQAVLQGVEQNSGSSGEAAMSKEEIEKLLRHGAYDIFNEDKAGSAEAESNAFIQQDIDSILERRSKTVVHDNTGSKSSAAGGTFSKASFKAPEKAGDEQVEGQGADIDIDDPEFWKKMVGEAAPETGDDLAGTKRKRNQANYSEAAFDRNIDKAISMSSDDESSYDNESPSDTEADSLGSPQATNESPLDATKPKAAKKRKKQRKEKAKWGGSKPNEWEKTDATNVLKMIQAHGYGILAWDTFFEKTGLDSSRFHVNEVKRMCWSILLICLLETAEEECLAAKKKAERAEQKKLAAEGNPRLPPVPDGGVLVNTPSVDSNAIQPHELEAAFVKLLETNASWAPQTIKDANLFASTASPRSKTDLDQALLAYTGKELIVSQGSVTSMFAGNIWPSLKSRGWTSRTETEGSAKGKTLYVHDSKSYKSPEDVLAAVPSIHPELAPVVSKIQLAAGVESDKLKAESEAFRQLNPSAPTAVSLKRFLDMFAPLQLLVDRAMLRRGLSLNRKTLSTCCFVQSASTLASRAEEIGGSACLIDKIAKLLPSDKGLSLPHPAWTSTQDAVLINAIVKHGWIDHDRCCRSITKDSTIKWGSPFDDTVYASGSPSGPITKNNVDIDTARQTALRVRDFFNDESDLFETLKAFNRNLVASSYGLEQKSLEGGDQVWSVSDALLGQVAHVQGEEGDEAAAPELVELPTKKDLLKRVKSVLTRLPTSPVAAVETLPAPEASHGYTVLDQRDPCNIFLAEMLRALVKTAFTKKSELTNACRKLCVNAIHEAESRSREMRPDSLPESEGEPMDDMKRIVAHIQLVARHMRSAPRTAKNVLRAVLGIPVVHPKNPSERLFPPATMELELIRRKKEENSGDKENSENRKPAVRKKLRETGCVADMAVSQAIALARQETKNVRRGFSPIKDLSTLEMSSTEILIINVICSQGFPVWTDHWRDLLNDSDGGVSPELQGPGYGYAISWQGVAYVFEQSAEYWHSSALKKLVEKRKAFKKKFGANGSLEADTSPAKLRLKGEIEEMSVDEKFKRHTLSHAKSYIEDPSMLARKAVMLFEAIRIRMGPVESKHGITLKKMKNLSKTENKLGPFVLSWLGKELIRWARSLEILEANGRPMACTAADFVQESMQYNDDDTIGVAAIFDRKACRAAFTQASQQSRLRSIFLKSDESVLEKNVEKAARNCLRMEDKWSSQPPWWNSGPSDDGARENLDLDFDFELLDGILEYGYSGFNEMMETKSCFTDYAFPSDEEEDIISTLTTREGEERANMLVRELHALDDTAENLALLHSSLPSSSASSAGVQTGIASFFAKKSARSVIEIDGDESPGSPAKKVRVG